MAENVLYADLNFSESTRPRILTVPDVQGSGCTYAEVKVKSQDTNAAAKCKSSNKSCCSRKHVCVLVVIILILILALAVYLIITYGSTAGSQNSSTTSFLIPEEPLGCSAPWRKHGRKCYFFSSEEKVKNWEASREECAAMGSDLVVIESQEELDYLHSQSKHEYYLLGLKYSETEQKWKWINGVEHNPALFNISGRFSDYQCMVIAFLEVQTAPCNGSSTTKNMCEKPATMSKSHQEES